MHRSRRGQEPREIHDFSHPKIFPQSSPSCLSLVLSLLKKKTPKSRAEIIKFFILPLFAFLFLREEGEVFQFQSYRDLFLFLGLGLEDNKNDWASDLTTNLTMQFTKRPFIYCIRVKIKMKLTKIVLVHL